MGGKGGREGGDANVRKSFRLPTHCQGSGSTSSSRSRRPMASLVVLMSFLIVDRGGRLFIGYDRDITRVSYWQQWE